MTQTIVNNDNMKQRMLVNTLSNYGKMIVGMFITIFLTRILFLGLSHEEYGYWALLWSIFGYSLLLDFGFGTAAQKHTSHCAVTQNWEKYNRIISTIFFTYSMFAALIFVFALVLSFNLQHIFDFDPKYLSSFRNVMLLFGLGSAICFPFGFFAEILRGLQRMHIRNLIQISFMVLNFIGMAVMMHNGLGLKGMVFVAMGTNLGSSLIMMILAKHLIPSFKISIKLYDKSLLKEVLSFSIFAYLITFTNLIIMKTDQLVISIFGSVALVAIYQISIRLADTYQKFSSQFLDNLGPVAATLFAVGDKDKMKSMLLQSNRLMGIISSLLLVPLLIYVKPLLNIWLNLDSLAGIICAVILLISMYNLLFFRSCSVYVLLMAEEHKILAIIAIIEAMANLILSILLIKYLPAILNNLGIHIPDASIIGVALGTMIPNLVLGISFNIPKACKFAGIKLREYFAIVVNKTALIMLCSLGFAVLLYYLHSPNRLIIILFYAILTSIFNLCLNYLFGLSKDERQNLNSFAMSFISKMILKFGI